MKGTWVVLLQNTCPLKKLRLLRKQFRLEIQIMTAPLVTFTLLSAPRSPLTPLLTAVL